MSDSIAWTRNPYDEAGNVVRCWQRDDDEVLILDVRALDTTKLRYRLEDNNGAKQGFLGFCDAGEAAIADYGIIPRGSAWEHTGSGNRFIVENNDPAGMPENHPAHPSDYSEPWVYCSAPDYTDRDDVWLARRLFETQLVLLDWNL